MARKWLLIIIFKLFVLPLYLLTTAACLPHHQLILETAGSRLSFCHPPPVGPYAAAPFLLDARNRTYYDN